MSKRKYKYHQVKWFTMYLHFLVVSLSIGIILRFKIKYVYNNIVSSENPFLILIIHFHGYDGLRNYKNHSTHFQKNIGKYRYCVKFHAKSIVTQTYHS